jgi:rubredoxin
MTTLTPETYGPETFHSHRCDACNHVWSHEKLYTGDLPEAERTPTYDAAHMCPVCHTGPYLFMDNLSLVDSFRFDAAIDLFEARKTGMDPQALEEARKEIVSWIRVIAILGAPVARYR